MKTPLGKVKGLGSAKSGTHHWWVQRATAVALFPLSLWFVVSVAMLAGANYEGWIAWAQNLFVSVFLILFAGLVFYHLKLGIQVVVEDYVHGEGAKLFLLFLNAAVAWIFGLLSVIAVLRIALGS